MLASNVNSTVRVARESPGVDGFDCDVACDGLDGFKEREIVDGRVVEEAVEVGHERLPP